MRYGIPYDWMTPDVFGEKYGGGRIPAGTRGYTWSNWQGWLADDKTVEDYQRDEMVAGAVTLVIVGAIVGGIVLYDKLKEGF